MDTLPNTNPETFLYEDAQFIGLHPEALVDGDNAFFQTRLEIAVGANRQERDWRTVPMSRGELVHSLLRFQRGPKDGACITQGPLINGQRIAKNVIANHIIMLDCDTGESLADLERKVRDANLFAILWTTYSHMKSTTDIPEDRLVKLARDLRSPVPSVEDEQDELCELARTYLASKKYHKPILSSIHRVDKEHREGGIKYVVHHDPMPRARILMFLDKPYVFASAKATQQLAIQDWKEAYAGVAEMLGVDYDQSCVDPSRLMYTPRLPANIADFVAAGHDILVINGAALDLDTVPRIKKGERYTATDHNPLLAAADSVNASGENKFKTPGLRKFLAQHGDDFDIIGFCDAHDELLSNNGEKAELACPNEDRHTEQKADDRAFMVRTGEGGWWAGCQHATCKEDSKGDRAWWLDTLCQKYGVGVDELLTYCNEHVAEEAAQAEQQEKTKDSVEDAIAGLTSLGSNVTADQITEVITGISYLSDQARRTELLKRVRDVTRWSLEDLRPILREQLAKREMENAAQREILFDATPVPANPEDASIIWLHWDQPDQCKCAEARFLKMNRQDPQFFRRTDGTVVLVANNTRSGARVVVPDNISDVISRAISDFGIRFVGADETGGEINKNCPAYIITHIRGALHKMNLPELEKISKVPVFSKDGILITEKGYNPHTFAYYDPSGFEFLSVPDTVSDDDLDNAVWLLLDVIRDFPFSDAINAVDPEPIRLTDESGTYTDVDGDGFPWPNWDRGRGSRANACAMILQPFARAMISGPCPNYHVDKPAIGTGAGFLVDAAWIIAEGGERAEVKTLSHDNAEIKKAMTAALLESKSILFLDNIQHQVDSPDLAAALTAGTWSDRILGQSTTVNIPINTTFIMAGNRIGFSKDMMRRNVPIYMNAATPNPSSDRAEDFYKHPMLHEWVVEHRAELVWACHVIIKAWVQANKPAGSAMLQSFNSYSKVIGGILEFAGISGFLSNRDIYMEARSDDASQGSNLIARIWQKYGDDVKTMNDWLDACAPTAGSSLSAFGGSGKEFEVDPALELNFITSRTHGGAVQQLSGYVSKQLLGGTYAVDGDKVKVSVQRWRENNAWRYRLNVVK